MVEYGKLLALVLPALMVLSGVTLVAIQPPVHVTPHGERSDGPSSAQDRVSVPSTTPALGPTPSPPTPAGPVTPAPTAFPPRTAIGAPSTEINGSVHVNGSFTASSTYLDGTVHIVGSTVTSNLTQTVGWAEYGATLVTGSMRVVSLPGDNAPIFASRGGGSLWVQPSPLNATAFNILEGDISLGDPSTGDTFLMSTNGVNITIDAGQAGGFYSYGGGTNINVGNASQVLNYANSSGALVIHCTVPLFCPTTGIQIAPGTLYVSAYCVVLLGCLSVPVSSITWPADSHFTILGSTTTSGSGMTAALPDSRMDIEVPEGSGVNISMTPDLGAPQLTVSPGVTYPALVTTLGRVAVSHGEALNASVTVHGTFSASGIVENGGTFYNDGGLTIQGELDSQGEQLFKHKLQLGPEISIRTFPGAGVLTSGLTTIDSDVTIQGTTNASGNLTITGVMTQNATLIHIQGNLSLNGTMTASGSVGTDGTTAFSGNVSSSGLISLPHAFMDGTFSMTGGSFVGVGSTLLSGSSVGVGWTWVNDTTYSVSGSAWLNGTVEVNRSITVTGSAELVTAPGGSLHLTATVLMGGGAGYSPWTSKVEGSVLVRGASFSNGTSTFNGTTVSFPSGLKVVGVVQAQGNVTVLGTTAFTGAVTSSGSASFPGMSLTGTFGLSSVGGSVNGTGTSGVAGNVTLDGTLTVAHGVFAENGSSVITGNLRMTGSVLVTGRSTLATAGGTTLSLFGDIDLANAAQILGNVNTTGNVTISGSAYLSSAKVTISGSLQADGWVYSRGVVDLSGTADFQGQVFTLGHTQLPGLDVAGNYTLSSGEFDLKGQIALTGYTKSSGMIVANASGYFVDGPSYIVGHTVATGSATVWGTSLTVGYVTLGPGARMGGYTVVHGGMSAGGLPLSGTVILPNDTVVFPQGANITGSIRQFGLLTSQGGVMSFYGQSIVNGTVVSQAAPSLQGPLLTTVLGSPFAFTLGPEFFAFFAALLLTVVITGLELFRIGWKHRVPFTERERRAVARLWPGPVLSAILLLAGLFTGSIGGLAVGQGIGSGALAPQSDTVAGVFVAASALMFLGALVWVLHRAHYAKVRRRERLTPPPATEARSAPSSHAAGPVPPPPPPPPGQAPR